MMTPEIHLKYLPKFHLAQINIAQMKAPLTDPVMAEFADALDEVNAIADQSSGFIWRLQTASGNATDIQAYSDPRMLVNVSVWQDIEPLKTYVYKSLHGEFFVRRRQWFEKYQDRNFAMWWVPVGHLPTVKEGKMKLEYLTLHGDSPEAFTFTKPYPPPEYYAPAAQHKLRRVSQVYFVADELNEYLCPTLC